MAQRPHSAPHLPIATKYQPPSPRQALPVGGNAQYQPPSPHQVAHVGGNIPLRLLAAGRPDDVLPKPSAAPTPVLPQHYSKAGQSPTANLRRIGSIAEEFVVEALLGKGSYGSAYRARRIRDGVLCAVKRVCMEGMSADDLRETLTEVQVLQSLHHPFVIEMQSCFLTSKHLNIVMPLADCGDLSSFIKNQKGCALAESEVLIMFTQICCALKHVHDRKILHRDIKSANILLCTGLRGNLEAKLADFGIARVLHGTMELASTAVGTPYYMSPELCKNESYDSKSDVWALGCLLYEMCTQKNPFTGVNFSGLALKILRGKYPPLPSSYSRNMSVLVSMMLEVDAHKRPNVSQILKLPFIASLLPRVLDKDTLRREFSHTILHGFCADDVKSALQEVASDPRYEAQFQQQRAHTVQNAVASGHEREREKPLSANHVQPREDSHQLDVEQENPRPKPVPSTQEQPYEAKVAAPKIFCPTSVNEPALEGPRLLVNKQVLPAQQCAPTPFQPYPMNHVANFVPVPAASEVAGVALSLPVQHVEKEPSVPAQVFQQGPPLQQPNEPNPSSAAFVIVHVETPMHLSKKGGADAEPVMKLAQPPQPQQMKKPSLDSTVRTNFTLLGSTLQLEQKVSAIEASASLRVEMLRAYLEKNLGVDVFCKYAAAYFPYNAIILLILKRRIYDLLVSVETHITDEDLERDLLAALKDPSKSCFLNVVCQLIVCEDRLNAHYNKESLTLDA